MRRWWTTVALLGLWGQVGGGCSDEDAVSSSSDTDTDTDTSTGTGTGIGGDTQSSGQTSTSDMPDPDPDSMSTSGGASVDSSMGVMVCPVASSPAPRELVLVVGNGVHMDEEFGRGTRYAEVREAWFDARFGVVVAKQSEIKFGMMLHGGLQECLVSEWVPPGYDTAEVLAEKMSGEPSNGLNRLIEGIGAVPSELGDGSPNDPTLILVIGAEPDMCGDANVWESYTALRGAIVAMHDAGIATRIIALSDVFGSQSMQQLANEGVGETNAPYWVVGDMEEVRDAMTEIFGVTRPCEFSVEGTADDPATTCRVLVDGVDRDYGDPDGWTYANSTIVLHGEACSAHRAGTQENISVSCDC